MNVVHLIQAGNVMSFGKANIGLFLDYEGNIKLAKAIWEDLIRRIFKDGMRLTYHHNHSKKLCFYS